MVQAVERMDYRPQTIKDLVYFAFLFATALDRYKELILSKHMIFDSLKAVVNLAERLQQQIQQSTPKRSSCCYPNAPVRQNPRREEVWKLYKLRHTH